MPLIREHIELMAPVGSYESLQAAIQAGADSVYLGTEKLNMRSRSSYNFKLEELDRIVSIAREAGMKTYLTLNSVIYNNELDQVQDIIQAAKKSGIYAIIAADPSIIQIASNAQMEVHLSTQMNISNIESLRFYADFADVVVLARELNLEQVRDIAEEIQKQDIRGPSGDLVRLEVFIHGALCLAVSGKCYLSLHQYGYPANRGECLQACRRSYLVTEKETGKELHIDREYIMSPKDLCTISFIDKIIEAGVSVLKIEGRGRSPEYVKTVTSCYNEALGDYFRGSYGADKIRHWEERLARVYNRGFWDGYYLGKEICEWTDSYGSNATRKKIYIGKGLNYFSRLGVGEFLVETGDINKGDEILITGPTTGVIEMTVEELEVDKNRVQSATRGEHFTIPVPDVIRRSDKLYKIVENK